LHVIGKVPIGIADTSANLGMSYPAPLALASKRVDGDTQLVGGLLLS
jgi:hypothetical protein